MFVDYKQSWSGDTPDFVLKVTPCSGQGIICGAGDQTRIGNMKANDIMPALSLIYMLPQIYICYKYYFNNKIFYSKRIYC